MSHSHSRFTAHLERNLGPILTGSFTKRFLIPFPLLLPNVLRTNLGLYPQFFDILPSEVGGQGGRVILVMLLPTECHSLFM